MINFHEYIKKDNGTDLPQILGIFSDDIFYHFDLNTFHYNERPRFFGTVPKQHCHNVFHIVFYGKENTANEFVLNGETIISGPGLAVLVPPGIPHCFSPLKEGGVYTYHEITFSLRNLKNGNVFTGDFTKLFAYYSGTELEKIPQVLRLNERDITLAEHYYCRILKGLSGMSEGKARELYMDIAAFLFFMIEKHCFVLSPKAEIFPQFVVQAREYIEKNYCKKNSLRKMALAVGISPEHLCRCFKECYGVSPMHYGLKLRISAAEELLRSSNLRISEISSRLGFSDIYTFSKAFKRESGISPGWVRR